MNWRSRIRNSSDFITGFLFIAIGISASWGATFYRMGDISRLGPGYFPFCLGVLLAFVGLIVALGSLDGEKEARSDGRWNLRGLFFVLCSVLAFGILLRGLGVVVAVAALVAIAALASPRSRLVSVLFMMGLFSVGSVVLFVWGLGVRLPVMPFLLGY